MSSASKYEHHYTYDDYCLWEGTWELIKGIRYAMIPKPDPQHQNANGNLYAAFKDALAKSCRSCKVYLPIDWKIAEDTIVQPDLLIVCDKIEKKYLDFPPVLVVEILSPSTASKDRGEKMELYQQQQVKYYVFVDPHFKKVEIHEFVNGQYEPIAVNPETYPFALDSDCTADVSLLDIWE